MFILQETTEWDCGYHVPNHAYITNDSKDKVYAYVKEGSEDINHLKNPLSFETRNRKFIIKRLPKSMEKMFQVETPSNAIEVVGSKGDKYYVENNNGNWSCTCVGYKYHGTCKHIKKVKNEKE